MTVGRFVLRDRLGAGAMGVVYAAYDPTLDREVALKLVTVPIGDSDALKRVEREARALARLRHPNVVTVHEVGSHGGYRFIAMDLVRGEVLRQWLTPERSWRQRMEILWQAGQGLAAAHEAGIIHRDFKPDNVLVERGHARVVDFGLARAEQATVTLTGEDGPQTGDDVQTRTGVVLGTPAYMAPESFEGVADARADQFAYCVTVFEALYGVRPFVAATVGARLELMRAATVSQPSLDLGVPHWLRRVVLRGLSFDADERWPDMRTLLSALERFRPQRYRRALIATGLGGAALGAIAATTSLWSDDAVCDAAADRMSEVWRPAVADATAEAFAATELAFAEDAWQRTVPTLNEYAEGWSGMRRATCEATVERGEQSTVLMDVKMRCLDRRIEEFAALVHVFGEPDREVVERSIAAAHDLRPVSECADDWVLNAQIAQSAAGEFPRAPQSQYETLAMAKASLRTGGYAEAAATAAELARQADAEGFVELAAGAYHVVAVAQDQLDDIEAAESAAMQAIERAEKMGDDVARAGAQSVLVSVLGRQRAIDAALGWARLTRATIARLGDPPQLLAGLSANEANALTYAGRYEDALVRRRQAIALRLEAHSPDDTRVAVARWGAAATLGRMGRAKEAVAESERSVTSLVAALGKAHPAVARARLRLADALQSDGQIARAVTEAERSIAVGTAAYGPEHVFVGRAEAALAVALAQGPDPGASLEHFERAIAIIEKAKEPDSVVLGSALANFGRVLVYTDGRGADAARVLGRALEIQTRRLGPDHVENIFVLNSLAAAHVKAGNPVEASATSRRAIALGEKGFPNGHPTVAQAWVSLGQAQGALGDLEAAVDAMQTARDQFEAVGARPAQVAQAWIDQAQMLQGVGQMDRAEQAVRQAEQALLRDEQPPAAETEWVRSWLAEHAPASGVGEGQRP